MKKLSKLVALILAITMVISMLPVFASAEDEIAETTETVEAVAEAEAPAEEAEAPAETEEAPAEAEAEVAEAAEVEAAAEELTEAAEPAEEVKPEAEVQEVLPEVKEELKEEEKEEVLVSALDGDEVVGTVDINSGSDYASFTRTFTAEDLTQKAAGKLVKVKVGSGAATYADTLTSALIATTIKVKGARTITLLGDVAMTDANGASATNCLNISGTNADWNSSNYGNLTFDLNGYTLSYSGGGANMFNISRYGFTLKNGNVDYDGTGTRSVIAAGTSSAASATSGKAGYTPAVTLENLTISAYSSGDGVSILGSYIWGMNLTVDHCEMYNNKYGLLSMRGTSSATHPADNVFNPTLTITNSMIVAGATYPLYIVKPDGATGGMNANVNVSDSLLVTNYNQKLMINAAFGTAGGTVGTPDCVTVTTEGWSGTAFDGAALTGLKAFDIRSGWDITFDPDNGEAATTIRVANADHPTIAAPSKTGYIFAGWTDGENDYSPADELPTAATTGAITYTALWNEASSDTADVVFVNYDASELQAAATYSVGEYPSYTGETPTKPCTPTTMYTFAGWTKEGSETVYTTLPAVTSEDHDAGTVTYTAAYDESVTPWNYVASDETVTGYETLIGAFNAFKADTGSGTIMLMADYTLTAGDIADTENGTYFMNNVRKAITIDLCGHTLTNPLAKRFLQITASVAAVFKSTGAQGTIDAQENTHFMYLGADAAGACDITASVKFQNLRFLGSTNTGKQVVITRARNVTVELEDCYVQCAGTVLSYGEASNWDSTNRDVSFTMKFTNATVYGRFLAYIYPNSSVETTAESKYDCTVSMEFAGQNNFYYYLFTNGPVAQGWGINYNPINKSSNVDYTLNIVDPEGDDYACSPINPAEALYITNNTTADTSAHLFGSDDANGYYCLSAGTGTEYTITWQIGEDEETTTVLDWMHPVHEDPVVEGYTFDGWTDGENTYAPGEMLPCPSADVTYTAVLSQPPFGYTSSDDVTTYYASLKDAYNNGQANDDGQGTIFLTQDWTLDADDHVGTNHIIQSPTKSIVLDLKGHTLTNDSNRNLVYADQNGFSFTLKSTGAQGGYVQTNKAVSGTTNRSLVAIGGTGSNASFVDRAISVTIENVHAVTEKGSLCMSYLANPSYTVRNSTLETADVAFSVQASTYWTATTTSNPSFTFENVTIIGKGTTWVNRFSRGKAVLENMSATLTLLGDNTFKCNNSSYKNENGFRVYTRYEGDSVGQYDVESMIDPANGYVAAAPEGYAHQIVLNGSAAGEDGYWTVTTTLVETVNYTVSWDTDGDGTVDETETVSSANHPTHEAPEKAGLVFTGWNDGETTYAPGETLPCPSADVTYTALFSKVYFSYTDGDDNVTQYVTLKDAFEASEADNGAGVITMLDDYTLQQVDWSSGSNYFVPTKNVTIDFAGHTLTDEILPYYNSTAEETQGVNVFFVQGDGVTLTFTSSTGRGAFVKSTQRAFVAFGGSGNSATQCNRQGTVVVNNVDLTQTHASASFSSYMARISMSFTDTTITSPIATFMSFQSAKKWDNTVTSNYALTLNNVTFTGKAFFWASTIANSSTIPTANCTASVTLAGTNSIKFTDANVAGQNGMQYRNRSTSYWSLIDPANGHVVAQTLPSLNVINLNGTAPDDGEYFTVTTSIATGHIVTWHLIDGTTVQNGALGGAAPTAPAYTIDNLDYVEGWSLTDGGEIVNLAEQTVTADTDYYMVGDVLKTEADFASEADKDGYIRVQIGEDPAIYGKNFTKLFASAVGHTATFKFYTDFEMGSDGTVGSGNAWNSVTDGSNLTFDLNGHTLETVKDSTHAGFDRTLFTVSNGANATLVFSNGTLRTNGGRHIIALSTSTGAVVSNLSLTATDVTFERTGAATNTQYIIGVCAPGNVAIDENTMPVRLAFSGCYFVASGNALSTDNPVTYAVDFVGRTTGVASGTAAAVENALPTTATFTNCSMNGVQDLVIFANNGGTRPNVKVDAETITNLYVAGQQLDRSFVLDENTYTAAPYELNPFTYDGETYTATFEFVSYSMKLQDLIYPNFQLKNEAADAFTYVSLDVGATENSAPVTDTATDGESKLASISLMNLGVKPKDSADKFGIVAYKDVAGVRTMAVATCTIDEIVTATRDNASSQAAGEQLEAAMNTMLNYNAWARYYGNNVQDEDVRTEVDAYDFTEIADQQVTNAGDPITVGNEGAYATSAVLGDQLYLKFYFYLLPDLSDAVVEDVTDPANVQDVAAEKITLGTNNNNLYGTVKVALNPREYLKQIRVTKELYSGTAETSATASIASYVKNLVSSIDSIETDPEVIAKTLNTAYAMLKYCEDVSAYFAALES